MLSKLKNKVKFIIKSLFICLLIIISSFLYTNFTFSNEDSCSSKQLYEDNYKKEKTELDEEINCIEKRIIDVLIIYDKYDDMW